MKLVLLLVLFAPFAIGDRVESAPDAEVAALLEKAGPLPVGVTTCTFYDPTRDGETKNDWRGRGIKTEIWYPATDASRALPRNRFSDFLDRRVNPLLNAMAAVALKMKVDDFDKKFKNLAARDARMRDGTFPLLLFSHGNDSLRTQSVFWCEHMASHGYIVVAPDHTGNALVTSVSGQIVPHNPDLEGMRVAGDRLSDLSFLIDEFERLNKGDDSRFAGRVDTKRIGAVGHSFGASTVSYLADRDARVGAISPWASFGGALKRAVPVLHLLAEEDVALTTLGIASAKQWFEGLSSTRYQATLTNGGHNSFSEWFQLDPNKGDGVGTGKRVTNGQPIKYVSETLAHRYICSYTLAFFDKHLKKLEDRSAYLTKNAMPSELSVRSVQR